MLLNPDPCVCVCVCVCMTAADPSATSQCLHSSERSLSSPSLDLLPQVYTVWHTHTRHMSLPWRHREEKAVTISSVLTVAEAKFPFYSRQTYFCGGTRQYVICVTVCVCVFNMLWEQHEWREPVLWLADACWPSSLSSNRWRAALPIHHDRAESSALVFSQSCFCHHC